MCGNGNRHTDTHLALEWKEKEKVQQKPTRDGFGDGLVQLGAENPNVVALCGDLSDSTRVGWFKEKYPDIKYYIVGDQSHTAYFNKLKELLRNLGLEENIFFWQNIEDEELIGLYGQADVFLLAPINIENNFEGFGLVYLEANASGLPVIGAKDCGAEDIIRNDYNGLLVPQNDAEGTAKAIIKLLDSRDFAKKLGENGMAVAKEMNWDKTVDQYFKVYKSIL